ncbi:MAG: hypothetical protein ACOWWO_17085 [Peptococcaceae bacterium]
MKRMKFLAVAMVLALMLMGAGYAYWQDQITLTTTVDMGEFDVTVNDGEVTLFKGNEGVATATIVANDLETGYADNHDEYTVTVTNAYPGLEGEVSFKIHNVGSIPAKIESMDLTIPSSSGSVVANLLQDIDYKLAYGADSLEKYVFGSASSYGGNYRALDAFLNDENNALYGIQLDPVTTPFPAENTDNEENNGQDGEYVLLKLPFRIDNIDDHEGDNCQFTIQLNFAQWNFPVADTVKG